MYSLRAGCECRMKGEQRAHPAEAGMDGLVISRKHGGSPAVGYRLGNKQERTHKNEVKSTMVQSA